LTLLGDRIEDAAPVDISEMVEVVGSSSSTMNHDLVQRAEAGGVENLTGEDSWDLDQLPTLRCTSSPVSIESTMFTQGELKFDAATGELWLIGTYTLDGESFEISLPVSDTVDPGTLQVTERVATPPANLASTGLGLELERNPWQANDDKTCRATLIPA